MIHPSSSLPLFPKFFDIKVSVPLWDIGLLGIMVVDKNFLSSFDVFDCHYNDGKSMTGVVRIIEPIRLLDTRQSINKIISKFHLALFG